MTVYRLNKRTIFFTAGFLTCWLCAASAFGAPQTAALTTKPLTPSPAVLQAPALERRPLVVLREATEWSASIWSGPATFVLYNDGLALYVRPGQTPDPQKMTQYDCVKFSPQEKDAFLTALKSDEFMSLKSYYPSGTPDTPQTIISVWQGQTMKSVAIDGLLRDSLQGIPVSRLTSKRACYPNAHAIAPAGFVAAYDKLVRFSNSNAQPWTPSRYELMLQAGEAIKKTISWPADWNNFPLPSGVRTGVQTDLCVYRLPLNEDQCARLSALEDDADANGVTIHGKKWASALYTHLPGEQYWIGRAW